MTYYNLKIKTSLFDDDAVNNIFGDTKLQSIYNTNLIAVYGER
jgi:hypothetical protein